MGLHCRAWRYHEILRNAFTDSVAKVVRVHLEQEVLEDVDGVVRDFELDDARARVLIQSHHSRVNLDTTRLLLISLLRLLDDRLERGVDEGRVDRRSPTGRSRSWHYVVKEVERLALRSRSWVVKDVEYVAFSCGSVATCVDLLGA